MIISDATYQKLIDLVQGTATETTPEVLALQQEILHQHVTVSGNGQLLSRNKLVPKDSELYFIVVKACEETRSEHLTDSQLMKQVSLS